MLVKDVDKKLDMRLVLRLRQNSELFNALLDLKVKMPVFIFPKNDEVWMATYFSKNIVNSKIGILLKRFNAVELEDSFIIDSRINNVKDLAVIDKLMNIPSFIVNRSDMSSGYMNVYARFHSSHLEDVSNLLAEYTMDTENARVEWLGPSRGILHVMDLINQEYPVSLITYIIPMNGEESPLRSLDSESILEVSNNLTKEGGFSSILYCDHPLQEKIAGVYPISEEHGIYSMTLFNQYLKDVRDKSNEQHIMRIRFFLKPQNNKYEVTVFLPTGSIYEYYSIIYNIARKHENTITVKHILPYTQDVWEFI
ncbi:MAG: hypothetical protein M1306_02915 [Candidatus Thermoplasmatota archaeon]|jgi:hypothetical protein|nr:hypothetical protein [Candidatus Thermoplasmatota archaeon]